MKSLSLASPPLSLLQEMLPHEEKYLCVWNTIAQDLSLPKNISNSSLFMPVKTREPGGVLSMQEFI